MLTIIAFCPFLCLFLPLGTGDYSIRTCEYSKNWEFRPIAINFHAFVIIVFHFVASPHLRPVFANDELLFFGETKASLCRGCKRLSDGGSSGAGVSLTGVHLQLALEHQSSPLSGFVPELQWKIKSNSPSIYIFLSQQKCFHQLMWGN